MTHLAVTTKPIADETADKLPVYVLRFVGVAAVVLAGGGLWYNSTTISTDFPPFPEAPYFRHAFYTLSAVCVACYITLLITGVQLIRLKVSWVRLLVGLAVFEVGYFFAVGLFWINSTVGMSVAAATGVASGGMGFQLVVLFPIWAPLLACWARGRIEHPGRHNDPFAARERIARPSDWLLAGVNFLVIQFVLRLLLSMIWMRAYPGTAPPTYLMGIVLLISVANAAQSVRLRRKRRRAKIEQQRERRLARGLCPRCEYNLTGNTTGVCPECGAPL